MELREGVIRRRILRISVLTAMFLAYIGLTAFAFYAPENVQRDPVLLGGLGITILYLIVSRYFWKRDMQRFGAPDFWTRLVYVAYGTVLTIGSLYFIIELGTAYSSAVF